MTAKSPIRPPHLGMRTQGGVSLVEIMVALVLSLILMAGVGQIYLGSNQTYRLQDGQSRLQENARYALEMLSRDIRRAGSLACQSTGAFIPTTQQAADWKKNQTPLIRPTILVNGTLLAPNNSSNSASLPKDVVLGPSVSGGDNASGGKKGTFSNPNPSLSNDLNDIVVLGTDAISIQFAESCGGVITADASTVSGVVGKLPANNTCIPSSGPLLISDCSKAHIFWSDDSSPTHSNDSNDLGLYNGGVSEIMRFRAYTYYIRFNTAGEPALYRFDNNANSSDEIAEGIEDMQIVYGVDNQNNDSVADEYQTADKVVDWAQVVGVRIDLRIRSVGHNADNLTSKQNPARTFNGNDKYQDSRLVKDFSISIKLRKQG